MKRRLVLGCGLVAVGLVVWREAKYGRFAFCVREKRGARLAIVDAAGRRYDFTREKAKDLGGENEAPCK